MSFYYVMHGATVGSLSLEANVNGVWRAVWSKSGAQQKASSARNSWQSTGKVSLPKGTTHLRLNAKRGSGTTGDIAGPSTKQNCAPRLSVLGSWVKPCGTRLGIRKGVKGAVRLLKILVLIISARPIPGSRYRCGAST